MKRPLFIILACTLLIAGMLFLVRGQLTDDQQQASSGYNPSVPSEKPEQIPDRPSPVPELISKITDYQLHMSEKIKAIRGLPSDLTHEEFQELVSLIRQPAPNSVSENDWPVIYNEIMEVLYDPRFTFDGYQVAMGELILDQSLNPVVRDYAAQHITISLHKLPNASDSTAFRYTMSVCLDLLSKESESFSDVMGTTLMSLANLDDALPDGSLGGHKSQIEEVVVSIINGNREVSFANYISAIQSAGRMHLIKALPLIRELARDESANHSYRLSSVAALGYYGMREDQAFLEQISNSNSPLVPAAQTALKSFIKN